MGDTGSEGSKPSKEQKQITVTFFSDVQKKQPNDDCAPKTSSSTSSSQTDIFCNETNSSISQSLMSMPNTSEDSLPGETGVTSVSVQNGNDTSSPEKRARVGEVPEHEECSSSSKQRSRKRCHRCQTKLELVQQELGSCRCGYVFCMLHRLPEQHECLFDHLGHGRQEAVLKMVKLDRKVGRSCQRIGEECS
uniref:Zinc finger, AN1-type domain 3 n=1 Tax=Kryptolebias marmoratus TaxID=37003 RepID=A0A3Q3GNI1_KRYMA